MARLDLGKPLPAEAARARIPKYLQQARAYEVNARDLLARGHEAKAGEAMWGAVASALKALALAQGHRLLRATEVAGFGAAVARKLGLAREYASTLALHANSYDGFLETVGARGNLEDAAVMLAAVVAQVRACGEPAPR